MPTKKYTMEIENIIRKCCSMETDFKGNIRCNNMVSDTKELLIRHYNDYKDNERLKNVFKEYTDENCKVEKFAIDFVSDLKRVLINNE